MRAAFLSCAVTLVCLLLSCSSSGPKKAEVSGTVSFNGVEIEEGSIQFIPVEGNSGPAAGGIIKNGRYHISRDNGVTVGKNRVELKAFAYSGKKIQDPTAPPGVMTDERIQVFPPEYSDNSTVIKEIEAGANTIDFHIRTDGK